MITHKFIFRYFPIVFFLGGFGFSVNTLAIDECNTTAQCRTIWGSTANDCADSRSATSVCMCGSEACSVVFGTPTPIPTAVPTPTPTPIGNLAPAVSFSTPSSGQQILVGTDIYVKVNASDSDGSISNVRLSVDGSFVRQENVDPYEWSSADAALKNLSVGVHQLTAMATDNLGKTTTQSISVEVISAITPTPVPTPIPTPTPVGNAAPVVSFATPSSGGSWIAGADFYVKVNASDTDGTISNVRLSVDGIFIRQENVDPYEWGTQDSVLQALSVGTHLLTAVASDDKGLSTTKTITVNVINGGTPTPVPTPLPTPTPTGSDCAVSGVMEQWHRIEVLCSGYSADENNDATFTDLRFDVTFTNGSTSVKVPGHFAADGNAADSGATSGDKWRAYFSPSKTGTWNYSVSFRKGTDIAVNTSSTAGSTQSPLNGMSGSFSVQSSGADARDMRGRGLLQHKSGERYLRFAGDNSIYIEAGMDSPENIFGYSEFDNTTKQNNVSSCKGILHSFASHASDWNSGDPTWKSGKGKALIGLVNYIASRDVNAIYIMMNTVNGDGCDAHPWASYNSSGTVKSFDVSKLDQWERVLGHMTANGIMIHVMTQETENDQLLNNGDLGLERKLYYRELVSRFAHHPALQWNLGEENTNTSSQVKSYSDFIKQFDPYDHQIVMHTYPNQQYRYTDLLGHASFDGTTMQFGSISTDASDTGSGAYGMSVDWQTQSTDAGKPWVVTFTEASGNNAPTPNTDVTSTQRIYWMWASVMSGGGGFEWYLKNSGSGHAYDLAVENLREFDNHWKQSGYLANFFRDTLQDELGIDLQNLKRDNSVTSTTSDWVLSEAGNAYVIFLRNGGTTNLTLPDSSRYQVRWMNPRTGVYTNGSAITGSGAKSIGNPPTETTQDWVVVVYK